MIKNICFCSDDNYSGLLNVAVLSLLKTNSNLIIHILKFDDFDTEFIDRIASEYSVNVFYYDFNLDLPSKGRFSKAMFGRLYISSILKEKKVLYLDCDIVVNSELTELFEYDMRNMLIGAVEDKIDNITNSLKCKYQLDKYFNSGVLLINNNSKTKRKLCSCIDLIKNNKYEYPDQDAINILFKGDIISLPNEYNYFEVNECRSKVPAIIHYALEKPWLPMDYNDFNYAYENIKEEVKLLGGKVYHPNLKPNYYVLKFIKLTLKKFKIFGFLQFIKWKVK
ncbi:glycosyltransferase family 8 protein [Aliivibrio fischeri]|uniref:Glycosyltransferase family 8 protein n=1 Tax=Aliivibrio fischeri TaxID=668 RepID=A0A844NZJ7_ALIFS|nr:glycosyltransferase family 8 protein [Aliivibrio fischeri]MUK49032.1 hypothetical protein [Aliivibrio fischeri]